MGFFSTLLGSYVTLAFVFQAIAVGFVGLDKKCRAKRLAWGILTLFTGPVGLTIYLLKGRNPAKDAQNKNG